MSLLALLLAASVQAQVYVQSPVAEFGTAGRVLVTSPGVGAGPVVGAVGRWGGGAMGRNSSDVRFHRGQVQVQPMAYAPAPGVTAAPLDAVWGPSEAGAAVQAQPAYRAMADYQPLSAKSLDSMTPEQATLDAAKLFDNNLYARKAVKAPAPVPPAPASPAAHKTETTKGKLPISRKEDGGSTFEPGLYSPSRLGEFDWNKDDYILHWVFRIKKPTKVIEAFMGGIAHQTLEQLENWLKGGKRVEDISLEDLTEVYNTLWDEQYQEGKYVLEKGFSVKDYRNRGETFVKAMWNRYHPFNQGKLLFFERKMMFYVEEKATGKRYRFQGIPDRVELFESENTIEISDWKTTAYEKTKDQLLEHDWQLGLYVLALRQNFPELVKGRKFRLKWNFTNTTQVIEVDEAYIDSVVDRVVTKIHEIETAEAQAEANRPEWERRINPVKAPKKMADAQKLVDRWTKISMERDALAEKVKTLEKEEEAIIARLLDFAKQTGHTTISGRAKDAVLSEKQHVATPTKTGDPVNYEKLAQLIKDAGLWEQFSALDLNEVKNMAKVAGHPHHVLYEKIKELVTIGMKQDMKLKDPEENKKK